MFLDWNLRWVNGLYPYNSSLTSWCLPENTVYYRVGYLSQYWIHAVEWSHYMPKLGDTALPLFILAWNCYETLQLEGPSLAERQQCALNLLSIKLSYNCLKHQSNHPIKKTNNKLVTWKKILYYLTYFLIFYEKFNL